MTKLTVSTEPAKPIPSTSIPVFAEIPKQNSKLNLMKSALLLGCVTMSIVLALCLLFRAVEASRGQRVVIPVPRWVGDEPEYPRLFPQAILPKNSTDNETDAGTDTKSPTTDPSSLGNSSEDDTNNTMVNKGGDSDKFEIIVVTSCIVAGSCSRSSDCCNGACAWVPGLSRPWCVQIVDKRFKNSVFKIVGTVGNSEDDGSDSSEEDSTPQTNDGMNDSDESNNSNESNDSASDEDNDGNWPNNENQSIQDQNSSSAENSNEDDSTDVSNTPSSSQPTTPKAHQELFTELMPTEYPESQPTPAPRVPSKSTTTSRPTVGLYTTTQQREPRNFFEKWFYDTVNNVNNLVKSLS